MSRIYPRTSRALLQAPHQHFELVGEKILHRGHQHRVVHGPLRIMDAAHPHCEEGNPDRWLALVLGIQTKGERTFQVLEGQGVFEDRKVLNQVVLIKGALGEKVEMPTLETDRAGQEPHVRPTLRQHVPLPIPASVSACAGRPDPERCAAG